MLALGDALAKITELLQRWHAGDRAALEELMPQVYDELRVLARRTLGGSSQHTLNPTVLVHEAFLRVRERPDSAFESRGHFFAVAGMAMRHIVIDEARRRQAVRHGGAVYQVDLHDQMIPVDARVEVLLALDQALDRLGRFGPRLVQVVECRYFAGLTLEETAEALGVVRKTVQRDWLKAQALLRRELGDRISTAQE